MKILAIETSTMLGGAAIMDDSIGLIAEIRLNVKSTHSERLMTEIDNLIRQSLLEISEIDAFAISIGPGSFTGLRIGLSTIKGLSFATGKPVVSISTLEAFAWNFPFCKYPVCLLLDARKKEVYTAVFKWTDRDLIKISPEKVIGVKQLLEDNIFSNSNILFAGEGSLIYKEEITKKMGSNAIFAPPEKMVPLPSNVAFLGLKKALKNEFSELISLVPFYIRKSEAEIKADG
ncbi:MAG: tRNA (adenosine(37)-N6)-threonylcarbamoyltransferase complex dimerization subunit type 1 TsaB [Nitrospirae bacterium]|jgi:tRNA threonylcarbamoyladenosine biosynthesis protein TsaB|nr:tRNA (adenosine(37)-N6)-threonylcarbamoyltransferase complex dimerization subunit type 1 TsaB [Nitrospirota bacterium]